MSLRNTYRKVMRPTNIRSDSYALTDNSSITLHYIPRNILYILGM